MPPIPATRSIVSPRPRERAHSRPLRPKPHRRDCTWVGARTALFNWAYARGAGRQFLLRIEDTDRGALDLRESERAILEGLRWLGLDWDEGPDVGGPHAPYRQSERVERHRERRRELLESGHAYRCFCTHERLEALREEQSAGQARIRPTTAAAASWIRLRRARAQAPAEKPRRALPRARRARRASRTSCAAKWSFEQRARSRTGSWCAQDGDPTYNFVRRVDDIDMRITHVFRGEEHLVNTPKQVLLYQAFGEPLPEFGHLPLMLGKDKKKLSKRTGDTSLEDYRDKGYRQGGDRQLPVPAGLGARRHDTRSSRVDELVARFDIQRRQQGGRDLRSREVPVDGGRVHPQRLASSASPSAARRS